MDLELLGLRQGITAWRDQAILDAAELLNTCGAESLEAFESNLHTAGPLDMIWDPASYATEAIDREMLARSSGPLVAILTQAADDLGTKEPRFAALSEALAESASALDLPRIAGDASGATAPPTLTAPATPPSRWPARLLRRASELGRKASDNIGEAADSAARTLRDRTILHDRLRHAARTHLANRWMERSGQPRPVLAQVILLIDETAAQARMLP
ncbi:MAG: hypothetical protein P1U62_08920 [Alteraurantiacibacter sp. bin_em_oilr2.035]|nr:hypothetical protein [Alteraurantiacibacter sp. bin_em_oilr2.035]